MTIIVGWIPFERVGEQYRPTSAYIASDSRVTQCGYKPIDIAQKVFYSNYSPNIFGFCGDVIAGVTLIHHAISLFDSGWARSEGIDNRFYMVMEMIQRDAVVDRNLTILHITRKGYHNFGCCRYYTEAGKWNIEIQTIQNEGPKPFWVATGSGRNEYMDVFTKFASGNSANTSRNVFQALSHMIESVETPSCGGHIQLVGLFGEGGGRPLGVVKDDSVWLSGCFLPNYLILDDLELRNRLFERCDQKTLKLKNGAQAQPNELM